MTFRVEHETLQRYYYVVAEKQKEILYRFREEEALLFRDAIPKFSFDIFLKYNPICNPLIRNTPKKKINISQVKSTYIANVRIKNSYIDA